MRLTFRQGIARYQTDVYATATFLAKSGNFINLVVSPDPTVIIFAHRSATYVVEEVRSVPNAWGPFTTNQTKYLYWDINLLDASLTRGATNFPLIVAATAPNNPAVDQHWYDTSISQMKVWNGNKWLDKLRVFAATYLNGATIQPWAKGSQVGDNGSYDAGALVLDQYNKPLRASDGTFVTSTSGLSVVTGDTTKVNFETEVLAGMANEPIPAFSFVQVLPGRKLALARSDNWRSRIIGIVVEDLYSSEVGSVVTSGVVRNEQWSWPAEAIGRPIFCGPTGQVTTTPPTLGVNQIAGYVYDVDSIWIEIQAATILEKNITYVVPPVTGLPPVANFTASPVTGTLPLTVQFTSTALHNPTEYEWDFQNDGIVDSTTQNPSYTFTAAGNYSVKFRVKSVYGQDEVLKTNVIVVAAPPTQGKNTNLKLQLSAPLNAQQGETVQVLVTASNEGLLSASQATRVIKISDVGGQAVTVSGLPTGSTSVRANGVTTVTLPVLSSLTTGQYVTARFNLTAPSVNGSMTLSGVLHSPENDSSPDNNAVAMTIRIKQ